MDVFHMMTDTMTSRIFFKIPVSVMTRLDVLPIYQAGQQRNKLRTDRTTDQRDTGHIEHERNHCVQEKDKVARLGNISEIKSRPLGQSRNEDIHDGADRGEIVEADEWVHLLSISGQEYLNHDETHGLKDDTSELVEKADEAEVNLTHARKRHAKHNHQNI